MKLLILHLSDIHHHATGNSAVAKFPLIFKALQNKEVRLDGIIVVVAADENATHARSGSGRLSNERTVTAT